MNWLDKQVSLYRTHADNVGRPATFREILFWGFGSNMNEICALRKLDISDPDYKAQSTMLKSKLQGFTPAALLKSKAKGNVQLIERSGIIQFDFDYDSLKDYDIEEVKQAMFRLPFIGFCGLSCSGTGFYALALIAEPEKQSQYAEHCFEVLKSNGPKPDESKGKKIENLRYVSYDSNMLYRENPEPLKITHFRRKEEPKKVYEYKPASGRIKSNDALVSKLIGEIKDTQVGQRWATVQRIAFTLGGMNQDTLLDKINRSIIENGAFTGQENKYLKCAADCFREGSFKPLN